MSTERQRTKELSRDPAWRAVFRIFERFDQDRRIWTHVDLDARTINFQAMLQDGTFSGGELRMIEIAASLYNQEHKVNLWLSLAGLDDENSAAVVEAVRSFTEH